MRNSSVCAPSPPTQTVLGLVVDILLSIQGQGLPLSKICSEPRLQLLELNVGEVVAEHELRVSEIEGGHKCRNCAEFIQSDGEQCRFCTGTENDLPQASDEEIMMEVNHFDPSLLRAILVWEAATRRLNDESPLDAEILSPHDITEDEIDRQILKLRQNSKLLPMSRWRERMLQLEISPGYFEDDQVSRSGWDFEHFILADITSLARALTPSFLNKKKTTNIQEAQIVVDHGLTRWHSNRHFKNEKRNLLNAKSMVYLNLKDDENYKKYKKEADQLLMEALPEGYKDLAKQDIERKPIDLNADPETRLKELEERATELLKNRANSAERMNQVVPGLADVFKGIADRANSVFEVGRHMLQAQSALKNEDYETACVEFEAALKLNGSESLMEIAGRCGLLVQLADAQFKKGDAKLAEATFQRALSDADDITEAKGEINPSSLAHHNMAPFLETWEIMLKPKSNSKKPFANTLKASRCTSRKVL